MQSFSLWAYTKLLSMLQTEAFLELTEMALFVTMNMFSFKLSRLRWKNISQFTKTINVLFYNKLWDINIKMKKGVLIFKVK